MSRWKEMKDKERTDAIKAAEAEEQEDFVYPTLEELETDLSNTLDDLDQAFRDRAHREKDRYAQTCDSLYYFTVYFSNREQMIEFCESFGMDYKQFYFDGRELAKRFRHALRNPDTQFSKIRPFNKDFVARARDYDPKPANET